MNVFKLIGLGFGIIGLALLLASGFVYNNTRAFIDSAVTTTGTIVDMVRERSTDRKPAYYPLVAFETAAGEQIEFQSNVGSESRTDRTGETVPVIYDPAEPHNAEINTTVSLWFGFWLLVILGVGFTGLGFGAFVYFAGHPEAVQIRVGPGLIRMSGGLLGGK